MENSNGTRRVRLCTVVVLLAGMGAGVAGEAGEAPRIGFLGANPPPVYRRAAEAAGFATVPEALPAEGPLPDLIVAIQPGDRLRDRATAERLAAYVRDGGSLLLSAISTNERIAPALDDCLPVNAWCYREAVRNWRGRVPVAVSEGADNPFAALAADGRTPALTVDKYIELHLPFAPVENSLARYFPVRYRKPVWNNDWKVLLETALVARAPMLVEGRAGAGRTFIFGGELHDRAFMDSPDAEALLTTLLAHAVREREAPAAAEKAAAPDLALDVAPALLPGTGSTGDARLATVRRAGSGAAPLPVVVSVKVAGIMRELIDAHTFEAVVPARGGLALTARQLLPDPARPEETRFAAERELPYRRLTIGVLSRDRRRVLAEADVVVGQFQPIAMRVTDVGGAHGDFGDIPVPFDLDGTVMRRYAYVSGGAAVYELEVANGLVNLAPLAAARDIGYPGNWSTAGLNDFSYANTDAKGNAIQGGWSGKQAERQEIALAWSAPVTVAGHRVEAYGKHRGMDKANPTELEVLGIGRNGAPVPLAKTEHAEYTFRPGDQRAHYDESFAKPAPVREVRLVMTGRDPEANIGPHHAKKGRPDHPGEEAPATNTSLQEWEVYGWPSATPPPAARGRLVVTATEAVGGATRTLLDKELTLAPFTRHRETLTVPSGEGLELWRVDAAWIPAGSRAAPKPSLSVDTLFVPRGAPRLERKFKDHTEKVGLLCSRGWANYDSFGRGMQSRIHGWGGYDPEMWCWSNHLSEIGLNQPPVPGTMFVIRGIPSHYTNPFKYLPNGEYAWDEMARVFLGFFQPGGRWYNRGVRNFIGSGEDRWNGVAVGATSGWGEFIAFDHWLQDQGRPGLRGRLWKDIAEELRQEHGRTWQLWHMHRYADAMLDAQEKFAELGIDFRYFTHGSFPVAGGTLGAKLAQTHMGVGTDLFWELRRQDLLWSLGTRFAVIAINPDFRSSIYSQWGWVNSDANPWWYANNAQIEAARRQWYATYWQGRIDQQGVYHPYHVMGFDQQGGFSTQMSPVDYRHYNKTLMATVNLRPTAAAGYGMVVSWNRFESKIPDRMGKLGFGLFGAPAEEDIEELFSHTFEKLTKSGLPLSFVANTDSLRKWNGKQPLILVNGINYANDELAGLTRLHAGGAPLVALGLAADDATPEVLEFFGVRREDDGAFAALPGTETVALAREAGYGQPDDAAVAYLQRPADGGALRIWVAASPRTMSYAAAAGLARRLNADGGPRLRLPVGVAATTFVAGDRLFLALTDHTDNGRMVSVDIAPGDFLPSLAEGPVRIVDFDEARAVDAQAADAGKWTVTVPFAASTGRLLMFERAP